MFQTSRINLHRVAACLASLLLLPLSGWCQEPPPDTTEYGRDNAINSEQFSVLGDFEFTVDPADSKSLLLVTNMPTSAGGPGKDVVLAKFDGETGLFTGQAKVVATNYEGNGHYNGPEFAMKPATKNKPGSLGILYAGGDGVHSMWRDADATQFYAFTKDAYGEKFPKGKPPVLQNTTTGAYPGSAILGQSTYSSFVPPSGTMFFGYVAFGKMTDIATVLRARGFGLNLTSVAADPSKENRVFFSASKVSDGTDCGIYSVEYDMSGNLSNLTLLTRTTKTSVDLVAGIHPVSHSVVVYVQIDNFVYAYEYKSGHLQIFATTLCPAADMTHFRTVSGKDELVLIFFNIFSNTAGTYALATDFDAERNQLKAHPIVKISTTDFNDELIYLPAADKWALYVTDEEATTLYRCWVKVCPDPVPPGQ